MFRRTRLFAVPAATILVASAGLAQQGTQPGQTGGNQNQRDLDRERMEQRPLLGQKPGADAGKPWGTVAKGGEVIGATVLDANDENVGTVNDLIVDPRRGHVSYVILSHGGFLGIGADYVAIPWHALETRPDRDRTYQVSISQERLEQAPSFEEDSWPLLERPGWFDSTDEFFGTTTRSDRSGGWGMQSKLQEKWGEGEQTTISGTISKIDREAPQEGMDDGLVVTVQSADGEERLVHLGPAWYLEGQVSELTEGQRVEIQAREIATENRVVVMAESVMLDEGRLALRDQDGRPVWDTARRDQQGIMAAPEDRLDDPDQPGLDDPQQDDPGQQPGMEDPQHDRPGQQPGMHDPQQDQPGQRPGMRDPQQHQPKAGASDGKQAFVRGSDLRGSNIRSLEEEENIGTVNELAIDTKSGQITFVVAGFGGFAGIAETDVVLPWQALSFLTHEDRFMLAVEEDLLRTAPRIEGGDLTRLEDQAFRQEVYSHFRMDPTVATYEQTPTPGMHERQPWGAGGQLQEKFSQGERIDIRGTVGNVGRGEIIPGTAESVFVTVRDRQGEEHIVQLGPAWFLQRQDLAVRPGDEIAIEGRKIDIEGREIVLASTVRTTQVGLWLRDDQGQPRWDAFRGERHLGIEEPRDKDKDEPKDPGMEQPDQPEDPEQPDEPYQPGRPQGGN